MLYFAYHKSIEYSIAMQAINVWLTHNAPRAILDRTEVGDKYVSMFYHESPLPPRQGTLPQ